jgi:hypothetical protein
MRVFDRERERGFLLADFGVPMMLGLPFEEARSQRDLTHWALSCLGMIVKAALRDLDEEARLLLERAYDWLEAAVRDRERPSGDYEPHWTEADRLRGLALCHWLKDRTIDRALFSAACDEITLYFPTAVDCKSAVAYNLAQFILAGRFDEALDHFRACEKLKAPPKLSGIQCPGRMCYLLATHELTGGPDCASLERAFHGFLRQHLAVCLGLRSNGFGIPKDVPIWTLLDEMYFGGISSSALDNLR